MTALRVYLRRSRADEGHQQFSLDTQREGARVFVSESIELKRLKLAWSKRQEYVDDGLAGDDFTRPGLARLLAESQVGDVIVVRDQSRLGRDTLPIIEFLREMIQERSCRVFYYSSRQEVPLATVLDEAMTYMQGVGYRMELENIRSRTREALRARVRMGRVAGGRCFGYSLVRQKDDSGRLHTIAVVDEQQAQIVRRVFDEYLAGRGYKRIAKALNDDGIPAPRAGKRGTGSWAPPAVREILKRERYVGQYTHGKTVRKRKGKVRVAVAAPAQDVIRVEVPEWRIIDDATWEATQARMAARTSTPFAAMARRGAYLLSTIARCGSCGGSIGVMSAKTSRGTEQAYGCSYHHQRGASVCAVAVRQPIREVDAAVTGFLMEQIFAPAMLDKLTGMLQQRIRAALATTANPDAEGTQAELTRLKTEKKRLAAAVAQVEDPTDLLAEMARRTARIKSLESALTVKVPTVGDSLAKVDSAIRQAVADLRDAILSETPDKARLGILGVFPEGLTFIPETIRGPENRNRRVWRVRATAKLGGFIESCDPWGAEPSMDLDIPCDFLGLVKAA